MSKNPSTQNYDPKQTASIENNGSHEVELPIPEKKNDIITTNTNTESEKIQEKAGRTNNETNPEKMKEKVFQTGFDVTNIKEEKKDKRGNETERLERDDTTEPKTKDACWQQDKINEANNQQGDKQNFRKNGKGHDTRKDSIIDRPKTETYENGKDENAGDKIQRENYTHTIEEEKRDEINRKNRDKAVK